MIRFLETIFFRGRVLVLAAVVLVTVVLGYEATYLGEAKVTKFGPSSSLEILRSTQEINRGDRLTPTVESTLPSYSPHAPEANVKGAIVSVLGGVADAAQYSVVTMNLGRKHGMEVGHVLAVLQKGEVVSTRDDAGSSESGFRFSSLVPSFLHDSGKADAATQVTSEVKLPDERNGLVFIFRVFDRISYALVMDVTRPVVVTDIVRTP